MEAGGHSPTRPPPDVPTKGSRRGRRYYTPPTTITPHPGVTVSEGEQWGTPCDHYHGSKTDLIAAGLLREGNFPGDADMPLARATLYPLNVDCTEHSWRTPGVAVVNRVPSGNFTVFLRPSLEVQQRRNAVAQQRKANLDARREEARRLREVEDAAGFSLAYIVANLGADEVRKLVDRIARDKQPRRRHDHLRLVWSV